MVAMGARGGIPENEISSGTRRMVAVASKCGLDCYCGSGEQQSNARYAERMLV